MTDKQEGFDLKKFSHVFLAAALSASLILPAYAASPAFEDVPSDYWAAADIGYAAEHNLFTGVSGTQFNPSGRLSWAMLSTVLYRYAGSPEVSGPSPCPDLPEDQWYTPGIIWAYENRIFPFTTLNSPQLDVNAEVTRAEFCIMLYNCAGALGQPVPDNSAPVADHSFADMDWIQFSSAGRAGLFAEAETAILRWALPMGIMEGASDTAMEPLEGLSRAQAAAMLCRFDKAMTGGGAVPAASEPPDPAEYGDPAESSPVESEPVPADPDPVSSASPAEPMPQLIPAQLIWQNPELPNGCEATSLAILLSCTGTPADKIDVLNNYLPKQAITWNHGVRCGPDPQVAYAGNAAAKGGGWYCFENPVIQAGDSWLKSSGQPYQMKNLTGLSREELEQYLSQQVPVAVWATLQCQTPHFSSYPWTLPDGTKYYPYTNLHCFVLTGSTGGKYYAADPIYGWQALSPDVFWNAFDAMGRRAVTLAPLAEVGTTQ